MSITEEIIQNVRLFVKGTTLESTVASEKLISSSLFLIRVLPSTREAVLEYLSSVFDDYVNKFLHSWSTNQKSQTNDSEIRNLTNIQNVLVALGKSDSSNLWASIILEWSIELLGTLSSNYAGRHPGEHAPSGVANQSINEIFQLWMNCPPTKVLIDIFTQSFASIISSSPDICVDALLKCSVKYSPHFDWVVAHIGSCFPLTIVKRVLLCGLKDFSYFGAVNSGGDDFHDDKLPKMASVISILGHLATQHNHDIRKAILTLFKESLSSSNEIYLSTVPFLFHLASMSPLLLNIITTDFLNLLNPHTLNLLANLYQKQMPPSFVNTESLISLVVHLITNTTDGALSLINFLLDIAVKDEGNFISVSEDIRIVISKILDRLLVEHQRIVFSKSHENIEIPLLKALQKHVSSLCDLVLNSTGERCVWLSKLISNLAATCSESQMSQLLASILMKAVSPEQLSLFIYLLSSCQIKVPNCFSQVLNIIFGENFLAITPQVMNNLLDVHVSMTNKSNTFSTKLSDELVPFINQISQILCSYQEIIFSTLKLLNSIPIPSPLTVHQIYSFSSSVVNAYFNSFNIKDNDLCLSQSAMCDHILYNLSKINSFTQKIIIRHLIEAVLAPDKAIFLGSKTNDLLDENDLSLAESFSLSSMNKEIISSSSFGSACNNFSRNRISGSLKLNSVTLTIKPLSVVQNKLIFIETLKKCSFHSRSLPRDHEKTDSDEHPPTTVIEMSSYNKIFIALLLVELIPPDVTFNGIPWPEEEFMKFTVERDIKITKKFEDFSILWEVFLLYSNVSDIIVYCSAILRALMATMISQWEKCREPLASNSPKLLTNSRKIIQILKKSQLIPHPICHCDEILPYITPYEAHLLLLTIWRYIKENPPMMKSSDHKLGCDPRFSETLRTILHRHIDTIGSYYLRFFPNK